MELLSILNKRPLIVSGPCSAETFEQLMETATDLKNICNIDILRVGIWKPRTRPGNFEGVGVKGLPWLQTVKETLGIPVMIEVATPEQVELAIAYGVDILWVGARTTVNPFSVQAIADAMKSYPDVPVFIKNPVNPDVDLWQGAVERFQEAGVKTIGLIHRGFSTYGKSTFRNAPMWNLAVEMRRRFPNLPIINDPSHICGRRDLLFEVAQYAVDLDYDGLIIESHCNPDAAWSDKEQQVTPQQLKDTILDQIVWRRDKSNSPAFHEALEQLRNRIDEFDNQLLTLIAERMKISEEIGQYKKDNNVTILQTERWIQSYEKLMTVAEPLGLSESFVAQYYAALHMESINHQKKVMYNDECNN